MWDLSVILYHLLVLKNCYAAWLAGWVLFSPLVPVICKVFQNFKIWQDNPQSNFWTFWLLKIFS